MHVHDVGCYVLPRCRDTANVRVEKHMMGSQAGEPSCQAMPGNKRKEQGPNPFARKPKTAKL